MKLTETRIPDIKIIEPRVFGDSRGYFMETFVDTWFTENVCKRKFVQDNQSFSQKGTLRGLHYQLQRPQGKLVRCTKGCVLDVAVDMRRQSSTLGEYVAVELSAENKRQLWVPEGFAHGFLVLSEVAEFVYKCTDYYAPEDEHSLKWDDYDVAIDWGLKNVAPIISEKDAAGVKFTEAAKYE